MLPLIRVVPLWKTLPLLLALLSASVSAAAQSTGAVVISIRLDDAIKIANRAREIAESKKVAIAVVVVNREGRVILAQRMDNASFVSLDLAEAKARTAAALGMPTRLLEQQVDAGKSSVLSVPGVVMIAGGVPLMASDRIIAGVGISGSSSADDDTIASFSVLTAE